MDCKSVTVFECRSILTMEPVLIIAAENTRPICDNHGACEKPNPPTVGRDPSKRLDLLGSGEIADAMEVRCP
jgi:hypothetical protein